jgi:hypothetical protein
MENMMLFAFGTEEIESSHRKMAVPRRRDGSLASSAKGFYQFVDESVPMAIRARKNVYDEAGVVPPSLGNISKNPQDWTQDVSDVLFLGNIFSKPGSDKFLRKIGAGDRQAMVEAYERFHHTDPESQPGTNARAIKIFKSQ